MAFSSRNHLKIQEHVGLPLEICFPWPRFVSCLWDLHLTAWFQRSREVRYRLEIAISIPHWRLAVLNGFCSSDQLRQMVLIQNQGWLISSYTKPTLSVTLWSSRHLRGLHTFCGTTIGFPSHIPPDKTKRFDALLVNDVPQDTQWSLDKPRNHDEKIKNTIHKSMNLQSTWHLWIYEWTIWPEKSVLQTVGHRWLATTSYNFKNPTEHQQWRRSEKGLPARRLPGGIERGNAFLEVSWLVKRLKSATSSCIISYRSIWFYLNPSIPKSIHHKKQQKLQWHQQTHGLKWHQLLFPGCCLRPSTDQFGWPTVLSTANGPDRWTLMIGEFHPTNSQNTTTTTTWCCNRWDWNGKEWCSK